jgi:putative SOS response-associated peptidase YedK
MCGRGVSAAFRQEQIDVDSWPGHYNATAGQSYHELQRSWNVAPTQKIPIAISTGDEVILEADTWGTRVEAMVGEKFTINAKKENLARFPAWREAQRCAVIFNGFYEWQRHSNGRKTPHLIYRRDNEPLVMAGLRGLQGTVIVTQEPPTGFDLHHRFPVTGSLDGVLEWALGDELPAPEPATAFSWHKVTQDVGDSRTNHERLTEPTKDLFGFT